MDIFSFINDSSSLGASVSPYWKTVPAIQQDNPNDPNFHLGDGPNCTKGQNVIRDFC